MRLIQRGLFLFKKTVIGLSLALACISSASNAQGFAASESSVQIHSQQNLTSQQQRAFAEFQSEAPFFGAFYVSANGAYSWIRDINTLEAAKIVAQVSCEEHGAACSLYASIVPNVPEGREAFDKLAMSEVQRAFLWIRSNQGKSSGAAMAASGYWGYHTAVRGAGVRRAERDALRECRSRLDEFVRDQLSPQQVAALQQADLYDCRIIVSIRER